MTLDEVKKLRQMSSLPINKSIKSKEARNRLVQEIIDRIARHIDGVDEAVGEGGLNVLSIRDLCREMGIRPSDYMELLNEYPELDKANQALKSTLESNIEDLVAKKAQLGDMSAVAFYHKNYSRINQQNERLRRESGMRYLEELKILKDAKDVSSAKLKQSLVFKLLELFHIESSTGSVTTSISIARELASILNLSDIMEGNDDIEHLTPNAVRKKLLEEFGDLSRIDDATIVQAAEDSPEYAKMFPTDKEVGDKLRTLIELKNEKS